MEIKLYQAVFPNITTVYGYQKEYLKKCKEVRKILDIIGNDTEISDNQPAKLDAEGKEVYQQWTMVAGLNENAIMLTEKQMVALLVAGIDFKVKQEVAIQVEDINKTFNFVADKPYDGASINNNTYNNRCDVHMPGNMLASYNEVQLMEDSCTDRLQESLSQGWRMIAVCPQPDQRRPDYIMGRWNPDVDPTASAKRG